MTAALGQLSRLGIGPASPVTQRLDFLKAAIGIHDEELLDGNGMRGTLSHDISRVRIGRRRVHGRIEITPNGVELSEILQWVLGGTTSGSGTVAYPLADSLITKYVAVDFNAGNLHTYSGVAVEKAVIRAEQGGLMFVELDLIGQDETISGSFPSLAIDAANAPFVFMDAVVTVSGTTVTPRSFSWTIDNKIDKERFFNSQTLTALNKQDREISFECLVPYGDFSALYGAGAAGVSASAVLTNGGAVLNLSTPALAYPRITQEIEGRSEIMMRIAGKCYKSGANLELTATLNPGP